MTTFRFRSLGFRMVALFGVLLAAIAGFMVVFFPARMEAQAERSTRIRARALAQVMASAIAPAVEFDDADNAGQILDYLDATPDATFAVVFDAAGKRLASRHDGAVPLGLPAFVTAVSDQFHEGTLVVSAPVVGRGGGGGTLHLGFSLHDLRDTRDAARRGVALASGLVLAFGLLGCVVLASLLTRPIHRLTETARRIARGDLPPRLATSTGDDEVGQMTQALDVMLERLDSVNQQLIDASRHAGMAQVATGVLHNVGNVLTSVNVGVELLHERARGTTVARLQRTVDLLVTEGAAMPEAKRAATVTLLAAVSRRLDEEQRDTVAQLESLRGHVDHVKRAVLMQNAYARVGGVVEPVNLGALLGEAIAIACPDAERHGITVSRRATAGARPSIDRNRVSQVVVNLVANARDAVADRPERRIELEATADDTEVVIRVSDTGVGVTADDLPRLFGAGFTTKPTGHGFGLHSSAHAARQLGGTLRCTSDGPGRGATFTFVIPLTEASP